MTWRQRNGGESRRMKDRKWEEFRGRRRQRCEAHEIKEMEGMKNVPSPRAGICLLKVAYCSSAESLHGDLLLCFDANESPSLFSKWLSPSLQAAAAWRSLPAVTSNSQPQVADLLPEQHRPNQLCVCGRGQLLLPPCTHTIKVKSWRDSWSLI